MSHYILCGDSASGVMPPMPRCRVGIPTSADLMLSHAPCKPKMDFFLDDSSVIC